MTTPAGAGTPPAQQPRAASVPAQFTIGRRYATLAQFLAILQADAQRWGDVTVAGIFSDAFRRAAQLAYDYQQHRRAA